MPFHDVVNLLMKTFVYFSGFCLLLIPLDRRFHKLAGHLTNKRFEIDLALSQEYDLPTIQTAKQRSGNSRSYKLLDGDVICCRLLWLISFAFMGIASFLMGFMECNGISLDFIVFPFCATILSLLTELLALCIFRMEEEVHVPKKTKQILNELRVHLP